LILGTRGMGGSVELSSTVIPNQQLLHKWGGAEIQK